jgi:hypothetical protein
MPLSPDFDSADWTFALTFLFEEKLDALKAEAMRAVLCLVRVPQQRLAYATLKNLCYALNEVG